MRQKEHLFHYFYKYFIPTGMILTHYTFKTDSYALEKDNFEFRRNDSMVVKYPVKVDLVL